MSLKFYIYTEKMLKTQFETIFWNQKLFHWKYSEIEYFSLNDNMDFGISHLFAWIIILSPLEIQTDSHLINHFYYLIPVKIPNITSLWWLYSKFLSDASIFQRRSVLENEFDTNELFSSNCIWRIWSSSPFHQKINNDTFRKNNWMRKFHQ